MVIFGVNFVLGWKTWVILNDYLDLFDLVDLTIIEIELFK